MAFDQGGREGLEQDEEVLVVPRGVHREHVFVQGCVEAGWVQVQGFALTQQNREDGLNAVEFFSVAQPFLFQEAVEDVY